MLFPENLNVFLGGKQIYEDESRMRSTFAGKNALSLTL